MADGTLNLAAQLDLFGSEAPVTLAPTALPARVERSDDAALPLMLMRHTPNGSPWRGPGVWCHLRFETHRRVRGLDADGNRSSDVPSVVELGPDGAFEWYPTLGAAQRDALQRHQGRVRRGSDCRWTSCFVA